MLDSLMLNEKSSPVIDHQAMIIHCFNTLNH